MFVVSATVPVQPARTGPRLSRPVTAGTFGMTVLGPERTTVASVRAGSRIDVFTLNGGRAGTFRQPVDAGVADIINGSTGAGGYYVLKAGR